MASPRLVRRKISLPILRTPTRGRKNSFHGNRFDVIDHLNTQSHIAFLRKVSVNPNDLMYPVTVILPSGIRQAIVVPSTSKLKNVLEEVKDLLPDSDVDGYTVEDTSNPSRTISLNSHTVDFLGTELKVVKLDTLSSIVENKETTRLQLVNDLLSSEKQFRDRIHQADVAYKQPLRTWGLGEAELCLLFDGTTKIEEASSNLINNIEGLISCWDNEESCVANVFSESFWETHEKYLNYYDLAKLTLKSKGLDPSFRNFVNMQRSITGKPTIQALILAPRQRLPQYEGFLSELSIATKHDHKDKKGIEFAASRLLQLSEKRSEELQKEEQEFKLVQVQEKFPHDKIDLDLSWQEYDRLKGRRYNSPNLRHKKTHVPDLEPEKKAPDDTEKNGRVSPTAAFTKRLYIQEGPVKLSSSTSTNERYLFLFNDLLLVAKPKSATSFKLKDRIRISDIWIANCIDEVTENSVPHEKSFVIGWPTTNYVASFNLTEEKELWYNALQKSINERRELEEPKEVTIKVANKTQSEEVTSQTCTLPVTLKDDARSVVKSSLAQFQFQNEEPSEYQLYVLAKEAVSIPLLGHELPYAIRMNNYRTLHEYTHDENDNQYEQATTIDSDGKLQFILKKVKKGGNRANMDMNSQKKWKNPIKKSPIINWAMNKKTVKPAFNHQESLPPGKLFGNSLIQLSTEEEVIPKPIEDILTQLFRKGPGTTGIFRKSALQRTAREIRQSLDIGKEVDFSSKSAIVLATVLKNFFRSLPDSLIASEHYDSLVATKFLDDTEARVEEIKRILQQFVGVHHELMMRFLCALYHIQRFSDRNNMNSYNLSICVSPSILWPPANSKLAATEQTTGSSDVVCFLIDNYINIFSKDNEYLLGTEDDIQLDDGPGEDSDSGMDQVIYRCGDSDDRDDSEKENEPATPDFLVSAVGDHDQLFSHSDSSLNTNDSDELKTSISKLGIPTGGLHIDNNKISGSRSSPNSPMLRRKVEKSLSVENRINSDMSDQENQDHDQFKRRLLRQPKQKRMLSSTTASAELIQHGRHPSSEGTLSLHPDNFRRIDNDDHMTRKESSQSPASSACSSRRGSSSTLSGSILVPQKHTISQPIIQHFSTEYRPTPNIIFHSVDRRRLPAAPSYEEHIQRTQQSKQRTVPNTVRQQPVVVAHALVQHQSGPSRPKKASRDETLRTAQLQKMSIEERPSDFDSNPPRCSMDENITVNVNLSPKSSLGSPTEERRVGLVTRQPRVSKDKQRSPRSPRAQTSSSGNERFFVDDEKKDEEKTHILTERETSSMEELINDLTEGTNNANCQPQVTASIPATGLNVRMNTTSKLAMDNNEMDIQTNANQYNRNNSRDKIEDTFNSMINSLTLNVELNGNSTTSKAQRKSKDNVSKSNSSDSSSSSIDSPKTVNNLSPSLLKTGTPTANATSCKIPPLTAPKPKAGSFKNKTGSEIANEPNTLHINADVKVDINTSPSVEYVSVVMPTKDDQQQNGTNSSQSSPTVKTPSTPASPKVPHQRYGPFSLVAKKSNSHRSLLNSSADGKSQSLVLEKTLLTKAPKKIDQLTKLGERKDDGKIITARELRRTNRKLKSEVRNAFHDGFSLPPKDSNSPKLNGKYCYHSNTDGKSIRLKNKENLNKILTQHNQQQQQLLHQCNEKNNNIVSAALKCSGNVPLAAGLYTNTPASIIVNDDELQQDEAYAKIMSQAESYV